MAIGPARISYRVVCCRNTETKDTYAAGIAAADVVFGLLCPGYAWGLALLKAIGPGTSAILSACTACSPVARSADRAARDNGGHPAVALGRASNPPHCGRATACDRQIRKHMEEIYAAARNRGMRRRFAVDGEARLADQMVLRRHRRGATEAKDSGAT